MDMHSPHGRGTVAVIIPVMIVVTVGNLLPLQLCLFLSVVPSCFYLVHVSHCWRSLYDASCSFDKLLLLLILLLFGCGLQRRRCYQSADPSQRLWISGKDGFVRGDPMVFGSLMFFGTLDVGDAGWPMADVRAFLHLCWRRGWDSGWWMLR